MDFLHYDADLAIQNPLLQRLLKIGAWLLLLAAAMVLLGYKLFHWWPQQPTLTMVLVLAANVCLASLQAKRKKRSDPEPTDQTPANEDS